MTIQIDPEFLATISPEHAEKVRAYFAINSNVKFWDKGSYGSIQLPYRILQRDRKPGKTRKHDKTNGVRYELISDKVLGTGAMGAVFEVVGTLIIDPDGIRFKSSKEKEAREKPSRAVKIQNHTTKHPVSDVLNEYHLTDKASHIPIKPPTIVDNTSFTVMEKIKGRDLLDIISDDLDGTKLLSLTQRINLTKALLEALQKQAKDKGIIHRDIKPENIKVTLAPIQVKIFDYGHSVEAGKKDGKTPGTAVYAAPEIFDGRKPPQTYKLDVFSMARIIALIWHVETSSYTNRALAKSNSISNNVSLEGLFNGIGLNDEQQRIIKTTLRKMLQADVSERISIEEAISLFSSLAPLSDERIREIKKELEEIKPQLILLLNKSENLRKRDYPEAGAKLSEIATTIYSNIDQLDQMDPKEFNANYIEYINNCQTSINESRDEINKHRDCNYLLANILVFFASLAVFYPAVVLANKAYSGRFLFFQETQSSQLVNSVENSLNSCKAG